MPNLIDLQWMRSTAIFREFLRKTCFGIAFLLLTGLASGQSSKVMGTILDENGDPAIGASVTVKNSTNGTVTDVDGKYSLMASPGDVLVVTYVGYEKQEMTISNGQNTYDFSLERGVVIDELVVVGYGTRKKIDLTGAVSSLTLDETKVNPNTNIAQFLQGSIPGLNVGVATTSGGTPPISIRGRVSLNGNQNVLVILDGIQYTGSLSAINPNDIASIDVLKDASSTAIYGAQAANGVILITSRRGKEGPRPKIGFSSTYSVQNPTVTFTPNNREQYLRALTEAFYDKSYTAESGYTEPVAGFNVATVVDASMRDPATGELLPNDFNWWEEGTDVGSIWENNLSFSGATDKVNYLLSAGIVDQKGFIINDHFKRKSVRANLEVTPVDWWKVGVISLGSFVNQDGAEPALATLQRASPLLTPYDSQGNLIISPTNTVEQNAFLPYAVDDVERHNYLFANIYNEFKLPVKGLTYRLNFGNNYNNDRRYYSSRYDANQLGRAFKEDQHYYDYTLDNIVNYSKVFGKHDLQVTLLYGAIERKFTRNYAEGTGFTRLSLGYNNLGLASNQFARSNGWQENLLYQMARVGYKFNEKYLLTATVRRDGFSGFGKNNKYGIFPTLAAGWILSEESFLKDVSFIDFLKLRVGYGEIGNQTSRYSSLAALTTSAAYVYGDGGSTAFGQQVNTLGNENLRWERTRGINVGLDFNLNDNRTVGTLEYYNNNTYDLLFNVAIPNVTGFASINTNLGQINNTGFEATLSQTIMTKKDFSWSAALIFSRNINKIVTLTGQDADGDGVEDDLISSNLFIDRPISTIYGYVPNGVYDLDDERLPGFPVGSMSVVDQNGDGVITAADDRVFLGYQDPAYRFAISNSITYKGLTFSFFINSVQGGKDGYQGVNMPFANNIQQYYREDNTVRWNDFQDIDYWSPSNPNGIYPRNISGSRALVEPNIYEQRNFIRLQDIQLTYNFGATLLKKWNIETLSAFVSGRNLATFTNWDGWDPESGEGIVAGGRPVLKAFTVGLNVIY